MSLRFWLCSLVALCVFSVAEVRAADGLAGRRPNIILFIADDMAWDDSAPYGHPHIKTPSLARMAREGLRFDNAFLTCSSCSPSRCSIITGRYPHSTGASELHLPLPGDQVTFVEKLRESGYYTAASGKWHLGNPTRKKFDTVVDGVDKWVSTLQGCPTDKPFFGWFAFVDPHRPYAANAIPEPHRPEDVVVPPYLPDVPETRHDLALYYDEIARLDGMVGQVLDELQKRGQAENTLVLFISDNGRPFPRCKTTVYDSGIRTPCLAWWPGTLKPGSVTESLVSTVDLAPTFLELAGVELPATFQGESFLPMLQDPAAKTRDNIYAEHNWHDYSARERAVRSSQFKYIRNAWPDLPGTPPADAVRSETYVAMRRLRDAGTLPAEQSGCFLKPRPTEELYDVVNDPHELHNLAADPKFAQPLALMRQQLDGWEVATGDMEVKERRPDGFDRETGEPLAGRK